MAKYYANVRFVTADFEADSDEEAEGRIHELLDELGDVDTQLSWDNCDWTIYVEGDN